MLEQMLAEEGMGLDGEMMHDEMGEMGEMDPMGMTDIPMDGDESLILASLFGKTAGEDEEAEEEVEESKKKAGEDEEVEEEEVEEAKKKSASSRTAALRPQPKKVSAGAKKLGGHVSKSASTEDELANLWESPPDVSRYFG
jgi:hypothetical protein